MSQHDYRNAGHGHPGVYVGPPAPQRNGMAVAALVLGIVGLAIGWIPVVGFVGFVCGLVGVVLGLVGLRRRHGRVMAIVGALLSILAILVSIAVWNALAAGASAIGAGSPGLTPADTEEGATEYVLGDTADVDGLQITAEGLDRISDFGGPYLCTQATYINQSGSEQPMSIVDWKLQDPQGGVAGSRITGDRADLTTGAVTSGGRTSGRVCFADPGMRGEYTVIYEVNLFTQEQVRWKGSL